MPFFINYNILIKTSNCVLCICYTLILGLSIDRSSVLVSFGLRLKMGIHIWFAIHHIYLAYSTWGQALKIFLIMDSNKFTKQAVKIEMLINCNAKYRIDIFTKMTMTMSYWAHNLFLWVFRICIWRLVHNMSSIKILNNLYHLT